MAGLNFFATKSVAVAANSTITVLQLLAATNVRFRVRRASISVKGAATSDKPVKIVLMRQTTAGTMTSLTLTKADTDAAETLQTTAQHTATAEPTSSSEIWTAHANVFGGAQIYVPTDPNGLVVNGGDRVGLVIYTDSGASGSADISVTVDCEE
jgi:hypothetical protein